MRRLVSCIAFAATVGCAGLTSGAGASPDGGDDESVDCGTGLGIVTSATRDTGTITDTVAGLAADSANVYWTEVQSRETGDSTKYQVAVLTLPSCGGTPTTVASWPIPEPILSVNPGELVGIGATSLYVSTEYGGHQSGFGNVLEVPLAGGRPKTFANGATSVMATDSANAYWIYTVPAGGPSMLLRQPLAGGTPTTLVSGGAVEGPWVDATDVYWLGFTGTGNSLMKMPVGGGATTTLRALPAQPTLAVDATGVYAPTSAKIPTRVLRMPLEGGESATLATLPPGGTLEDFVVDSKYVYWSSHFEQGYGSQDTISRVPKSGGPTTTLATKLNEPHYLAVRGNVLYWTDWAPHLAGAQIRKLTLE